MQTAATETSLNINVLSKVLSETPDIVEEGIISLEKLTSIPTNEVELLEKLDTLRTFNSMSYIIRGSANLPIQALVNSLEKAKFITTQDDDDYV